MSWCYGARCHDVMLIVTCHTHVILCQLIKPIQWNVPWCHLNIITVRGAPGERSDPGGDNIVTLCGIKKRDTWQGRVPGAVTRHIRHMTRERGALSSCTDPLSFVYLSPQSREKKLLLLSLTFFWLVVPVLAKLPVVVLDELVVVVLLARPLGPL